jgi:EGF domain-containing protein
MKFRFSRIVLLSAVLTICFACKKNTGKNSSIIAVNKCLGVVCLHGGICDTGICQCPTGWSGSHCDTIAITSTWSGSEISTHSNPPGNLKNITCIISISTSDTNVAFLYNYDNLGDTMRGTLSTDKTSITFSQQKIPYGGDSLTIINGTINLAGNDTAEFGFNETYGGLIWLNSGQYVKK